MSMFEAFFLALIQGLTEFLPISSSAHLILPSQIFGWADQGLAFDVAVHVGTLAAVIGYFRREVVSLLGAFFASFTGKHSRDSQLAWMIVLATIPACVAGLFLKDLIELYLRSAWVIAATTLLFGALLWWADRHARQQCDEYQTTRSRALFIGIAQALALIPGTSRSGATITAALMLGYTREAAARFSFLMSIPIITLAVSYLGLQLATSPVPVEFTPIGIGVLVSFVSAYACIHAFLKLVTRVGMLPFVIYRLILGVGLIALLMSQ